MTTKLTLPKAGSRSLEILKFIGAHVGVRNVDVEKFIVASQGKEWDSKRRAGMWTSSLYDAGRRKGLYTRFCVKYEDRYYLTNETADLLRTQANVKFALYSKTKQSLKTLPPVKDLFGTAVQVEGLGAERTIPDDPPKVPVFHKADLKEADLVKAAIETKKRVYGEAIEALYRARKNAGELKEKYDAAHAVYDKAANDLANANVAYDESERAVTAAEEKVRKLLDL
jgi:hypothetical protein